MSLAKAKRAITTKTTATTAANINNKNNINNCNNNNYRGGGVTECISTSDSDL